MDTDYSFTRAIRAEDLRKLLRQTTWAASRTTEGLEQMLQNTPLYVGAWQDEVLVGFARALTDDLYRALIDDVVVDEAQRHKGIATQMMRLLLERLKNVEQVFLACADDVVPFYMKLGFKRSGGNHLEFPKSDEQAARAGAH